MAITINQQPAEFSPVYNPLIFVATSTNTTQANFNFIVDVYIYTGAFTITRHKIPARPDNGLLLFDASRVMESLVSHDINKSSNGFVENINSSSFFRLSIGEEYGATPVIYANLATTNSTHAFNSSLEYNEFASYLSSTYLIASSTSKFLTNAPTTINVRSGNLQWLYSMCSDLASYDRLEVKKYNAAGLIATGYIANSTLPVTAFTAYHNRFLRVGVGYSNIETSLGAGYLTGATSYTVRAVNSGGAAMSELRTFTIDDSCSKYTIVRLHFLNKLGGFDAFNFTMVSKDFSTIERVKSKRMGGSFSGSAYSYSNADRTDFANSTIIKNSTSIQSNWITDAEAVWLKELITSPVIFQELAGELIPVNIEETKYESKKRINDRLFNLQITLSFKDSFRQRY